MCACVCAIGPGRSRHWMHRKRLECYVNLQKSASTKKPSATGRPRRAAARAAPVQQDASSSDTLSGPVEAGKVVPVRAQRRLRSARAAAASSSGDFAAGSDAETSSSRGGADASDDSADRGALGPAASVSGSLVSLSDGGGQGAATSVPLPKQRGRRSKIPKAPPLDRVRDYGVAKNGPRGTGVAGLQGCGALALCDVYRVAPSTHAGTGVYRHFVRTQCRAGGGVSQVPWEAAVLAVGASQNHSAAVRKAPAGFGRPCTLRQSSTEERRDRRGVAPRRRLR